MPKTQAEFNAHAARLEAENPEQFAQFREAMTILCRVLERAAGRNLQQPELAERLVLVADKVMVPASPEQPFLKVA